MLIVLLDYYRDIPRFEEVSGYSPHFRQPYTYTCNVHVHTCIYNQTIGTIIAYYTCNCEKWYSSIIIIIIHYSTSVLPLIISDHSTTHTIHIHTIHILTYMYVIMLTTCTNLLTAPPTSNPMTVSSRPKMSVRFLASFVMLEAIWTPSAKTCSSFCFSSICFFLSSAHLLSSNATHTHTHTHTHERRLKQ